MFVHTLSMRIRSNTSHEFSDPELITVYLWKVMRSYQQVQDIHLIPMYTDKVYINEALSRLLNQQGSFINTPVKKGKRSYFSFNLFCLLLISNPSCHCQYISSFVLDHENYF
jgi:hypothetical protein